MQHIFILGGTTFDHIISLEKFPNPSPQTIHQAAFKETTGSTGSGKAVSLTKLNIPNTLYSILGDDLYGRFIIEDLRKHNVDFIFDYDPGGTERHVNLMNADGERISIFITQSTELPVMNKELISSRISQSDLIILNIISYCKDLIPLLKDYSKPVWTDLHDYTEGNPYHQPFIDASGYIFLSSDNLTDYESTMKGLISSGKELVVCTHGRNGSTALTKSGMWMHEPALAEFPLVDANGPGDNYFAGFLYAWLNNKSIDECMKYGTICGALCITSPEIVSKELSANLLEDLFSKYYQ